MPEPVVGDPVNGGPQPTEPGVVKSALTGGDLAPKPAEPAQPVQQAPQKPTWAAQLPKDLQSDEDLINDPKAASLGDLWKGYKELKGKAGQIAVPGEGASAEEISAYRKAIGVPEKAEDYALEAKDLPQGMKVDDKLVADFKAKAFELGIPAKTAQELFGFYNAHQVAQFKAVQESQKTTIEGWKTSAKEKWGDNYDTNLRMARLAFSQFGDEELAKYMDDTGLGEHPGMLEAFRRIGAAIADNKLLEPRGPVGRKSDAEVMFGS